MYPRASGGLGGPQTRPNFKSSLHTIHNILFYTMDFGISAEIWSCGFILPLRKNMITHSLTMIFLYFLHL